MSYASYLKEQARDCLTLAVAEPWSADVVELIDLAETYSSLAKHVVLQEPSEVSQAN